VVIFFADILFDSKSLALLSAITSDFAVHSCILMLSGLVTKNESCRRDKQNSVLVKLFTLRRWILVLAKTCPAAPSLSKSVVDPVVSSPSDASI